MALQLIYNKIGINYALYKSLIKYALEYVLLFTAYMLYLRPRS